MKTWDTVIKPKTGLWDWPIKEIWKYRGLIRSLVKRNYEIQYKQTVLGVFWVILGQIFSTGLFSLVFGYVGKFSSDGVPYFLFYMSGSILWTFFSGCVHSNSAVFLNNTYLFGKVYFPRMIVPLANCLFELLRFGIQFLVCLCVWFVFFWNGEVSFMGVYLLVLPIPVIGVGVMGMAVGLIVSSVTTKYRDLMHMLGLGMQILMYASPVLYPVSQLPQGLQKVVLLNPMTSMVEAFRYCLTGSGTFRVGYLIYSMAFATGVWIVSVIVFNQTEKTFIDIV